MADSEATAATESSAGPDPLDEVVLRLTSTRESPGRSAPVRVDPTADALSIVGAALNQPAVDPVDLGALSLVEGTSIASGWMPWRVRLTGRWFEHVPVPLLVRANGAPAAVVPDGQRALLVEGGTRKTRPFRYREPVGVEPEAVAFAVTLPANSRWWSLIRWSLRRQGSDLGALLALAVITGAGALLLPLTTGVVFQTALPLARFDLLLALLGVFAIASIGLALLALQSGRIVLSTRDRMDFLLGTGIMAWMLRLKAGFFRSHTVGDVANRTLAVETARRAVDDSVVSILLTSVFGLVSIGYLFAAGPGTALIAAGTVLVVLAASVALQLRGRALLHPLLEKRSEADALLLSILANIVSWRSGAAENRALARWAHKQQASTLALRNRLRAVSLGSPMAEVGPMAVLAVFIVSIVLLPGDFLRPGTSSAPGVFIAMYAALMQVTIAMIALTTNLVTLSEYGPQLSRLEPILNSPTEYHRSTPGALKGAVSLHDVDFGYRRDRTPLFSGMSLEVKPGEFVALVGPSGSGKSTLTRLLLGFEEPWSGMVAYDGSDLSTLNVASVRRQIGTVLQSSFPLGVTVRESICGPRRLDDAELARIVEQAGLAEDVAHLPLGLDTPVGDAGSALSGGQRQRIMVAAALAGDPAILLFDEATSALDNATQAVVMRTILESTSTRIVIAHRLSTVRHADRVLVVAGGTIAESGSPAELLESGGLFAQLAARQEL
jgi:ATP-binding cassette subfamily C protein